ncbi:MAG: DICT sensory domain-containing protein [Haloarculaceae archaeon]
MADRHLVDGRDDVTLASFLAEAERRRTTAIHYGADDGEDLAAQFDARNVEIRRRELPPGGPDPFLVLRRDGSFRGAVTVGFLRSYLRPPLDRPTDATGLSSAYRALFELLDDTVFGSLTRRQLLATSREIEDRARRTGRGTLHAGFQSLSAFRAQRSVYRELAGGTDVDVHVYAADASPADLADLPVTVHAAADSDGPIGRYWFLAFDGGSDDGRACALVAEQRGESSYYGAWTYDPALVERVLSALP